MKGSTGMMPCGAGNAIFIFEKLSFFCQSKTRLISTFPNQGPVGK